MVQLSYYMRILMQRIVTLPRVFEYSCNTHTVLKLNQILETVSSSGCFRQEVRPPKLLPWVNVLDQKLSDTSLPGLFLFQK